MADEEELKPVVSEPEKDSQKIEKIDEGPKRFVEHGPLVILDTDTGLYWLKKDSWQDKGKFFNWHEGKDYAERKNVRQIGGFSDWRIPTVNEAATLYDENLTNVAKGGDTLHIDPIFPEGSFKVEWSISDTSTRRPRFNYVDGKVVYAEEYAFGSIRICRKDSIRKNDEQPRRR